MLIIKGMNPKAGFGNKFRSKLRGIKPSASRDNSTYASNFTSFVFSKSHYNLPIPKRYASELEFHNKKTTGYGDPLWFTDKDVVSSISPCGNTLLLKT